MERSLTYMGLTPGTPLTHIKIDRMFIGSCNSRIEDMMATADAKGRKSSCGSMVVPGSGLVKGRPSRVSTKFLLMLDLIGGNRAARCVWR